MPVYYPPVGFHFKVEVMGLDSDDSEVRFTDVGGLSFEMATEEVPEGGENRFVQKYPVRAKYPELTLKRGMLVGSRLVDWVRKCIEGFEIEPKDIYVKLLNDEHQPLMTWHLVKAYPTKWSVSDFNASGNSVVVESIQLYYQYFSMDKG